MNLLVRKSTYPSYMFSFITLSTSTGFPLRHPTSCLKRVTFSRSLNQIDTISGCEFHLKRETKKFPFSVNFPEVAPGCFPKLHRSQSVSECDWTLTANVTDRPENRRTWKERGNNTADRARGPRTPDKITFNPFSPNEEFLMTFLPARLLDFEARSRSKRILKDSMNPQRCNKIPEGLKT